ncbi:MAG: GT-D fold domain-containing protein [Planctomycetaceae bacterium]|jgi:glycosyltransferase family protein|nr:GT-D fold domain-containing protein [Planctomycetaceae bacterium]
MAKKRYFLKLRRILGFDAKLIALKKWLRQSVRKMLAIGSIEEQNNMFYEMMDLLQHQEKLFIPTVASRQQTLEKLLQSEMSLARFGDGEFKLMFYGDSLGFQEYDEKLAERLKEVLSSRHEKLMIGLPNFFGYLEEEAAIVWRKFVGHLRSYINPYLNAQTQYYDTGVTRCIDSAEHFQTIKQIWENRDIVVIEGTMTRMGIGNNLLNNAKSIRRILAPAENAFQIVDKIFAEAVLLEKNVLFLIALGPTATILAHDLTLAGFRALDVGHLDICYELFQRGETQVTAIEGKYVNEASYRAPVDCKDENYLKQIICKVE